MKEVRQTTVKEVVQATVKEVVQTTVKEVVQTTAVGDSCNIQTFDGPAVSVCGWGGKVVCFFGEDSANELQELRVRLGGFALLIWVCTSAFATTYAAVYIIPPSDEASCSGDLVSNKLYISHKTAAALLQGVSDLKPLVSETSVEIQT